MGACDLKQAAVIDPKGPIALAERNLLFDAFLVMMIVVVPVIVLTLWFAYRYRASNTKAVYTPTWANSIRIDALTWLIPALIVMAVAVLLWRSTHRLDLYRPLESKEPPIDVQVVAQDWKWLFIYPEQGIATVNELVLPVDRPVRFDLTSTNMMNTFYAPTLAGMIYTMPGMQSTLHAVLNRPGSYEGFSANYSGAGFSDMRFALRGVDEAGFAQWAAGVKAGGKPLDTAAYLALEKPSEKVAPMAFGSAPADLFDRIVNRCVRPGAPCMTQVMAADRAKDGRTPSQAMPMQHGAMPAAPPPKGAIFKAPQEIAPGQNVTDPRKAEPPGHTRPAAPHNRDMSYFSPRRPVAADRVLG